MRKNWGVALVLLAAAAVVIGDGLRIVIGRRVEPGSAEVGGYEIGLGVLLALLALTHGLRRSAQSATAATAAPENYRQVWLGLALTAAYVAVLDPLGYVSATTLFLCASLRWLGRYRWSRVLPSAVALAALSAWGLALLDSPMPRGPWF